MANLRDIVRELIKDNEEIYSVISKVTAVDKDKRTCDVDPIDGSASLFDVRLQSKNETNVGLVAFPSVGSDVTVTFISKELAFVSCTNEIDKVMMDIGNTSILVDSEKFEKSVENIKINANETKITSDNYELSGENATFTLSDLFKVESAQDVELKALLMKLEATNINIKGITTITGATTINGAATISGSVTMGGGSNGGILKASAIIDKMNEISLNLSRLKVGFDTWIPTPNDGGAALKSNMEGRIQPIGSLFLGDVSNDNVKH